MKGRRLWIGAVLILAFAASAAALASLGAQDLEIIKDPPGGGGCICPANYDPVVCVGPNGAQGKFSNACVAGCYGFTHCARIIPGPTS